MMLSGKRTEDRQGNDPCGILVVDKEKGMTSHDVVSKVRKHFLLKKVGHAGTLDPNATGVLVLLIGKATKRSQYLLGQEKEYQATVKLGERTDSHDADGKILEKKSVTNDVSEIKEIVMGFKGESEQVPPMVSAKKVFGQRLYKLARKGISVEREPVKINIRDIEIKSVDVPFVVFRCVCSKGTYIRQLAEDIGKKLGCGAYLSDLRRLRSGSFGVERAVLFSELMRMERKDLDESMLRIQESCR